MRLLAGAEPHALPALSDQSTGTLVREIPDHATITGAWGRLYEFPQPAVAEARHGWGESMMGRCIQTMDSELPFPMTWRTATTIYNGFPTVLSAVIKMLEYLLMRSWLMQACREHPELIPGVVRGALKAAVHFTFGLPGVCMVDSIVDGLVVRAGTVVLPSFHGAEGSAGLKAWGSPGVHQCLGMHIARIILESAVRAITRRLRGPAVPWSEVTHREGTMPLPASLPVFY